MRVPKPAAGKITATFMVSAFHRAAHAGGSVFPS
jgi:hypothetical protein